MKAKKSIMISLLILTFVICIAVVGINQYNIHNSNIAFEKAINYEKEYNYNSALKHYSLVIEKDTDNYDKAKNKIEQIKELQIHIEAFENAKKCIENTDYENAYYYLVSVNKDILFKDNRYNAEQLQDILNICYDNLISIGKTEYDNKNYIVAYKCWDIVYFNENFTFKNEYKICECINFLQGERINRRNKSQKINTEHTTITIGENDKGYKQGTYTTYLGKYTFNTGERYVLYFDDMQYMLELPYYNTDAAILWKKISDNKVSDGLLYYNEAGVLAAEEEVENYNNYIAEQEKIKNTPPQIGMTKEQVENGAWGKPNRINKTTYEWGTTEQWCYSNGRYVYFKNGKVTAISE